MSGKLVSSYLDWFPQNSTFIPGSGFTFKMRGGLVGLSLIIILWLIVGFFFSSVSSAKSEKPGFNYEISTPLYWSSYTGLRCYAHKSANTSALMTEVS